MDFGLINSVNLGLTLNPETTRTVDLDNSMSASEIQSAINSVKKYIPFGQVVVLQCSDNTYTLNSSLVLSGFFGGGTLAIQGNMGESGLHSNQAVYLDFNSGTSDGIIAQSCAVSIFIRNLKIKISDTSGKAVIRIEGVSTSGGGCLIDGCYALSAAKTNSPFGILVSRCMASVENNYVENLGYGVIGSYQAVIHSKNNDDINTAPNYGLAVVRATTIGKEGTQPNGTTSNELASGGGVIR